MIVPLNEQSKPLYKKYNLLNKEGKIKQVNPKTCKNWLDNLNLSKLFKFKLSYCSDGKYRIFIDRY